MTLFSPKITPGVQYWVSPKLSMALNFGQIGYLKAKPKDVNNKEFVSKGFRADFDLSTLSLGAFWHL